MHQLRYVLLLVLTICGYSSALQCDGPRLLSCSLDLPLDSEPPTCCVSHPAGLFSYTQTWDQTQGKWLAGHLRLLRCDGAEYRCEAEPSRRFSSEEVAKLLGHAADHTDDGMTRISLRAGRNVDQYVAEQWFESGACISTLAPACTTSDTQFGVRLFYRTLDELSFRLDNSHFLASKRIYASSAKVYPRERILEALRDGSDLHPSIECEGDVLKHVEYRFIARGPFQDLHFEAPQSSWTVNEHYTSCPVKGVRFLPHIPPKVTTPSPEVSKEIDASKDPNVHKLKFFGNRYGRRAPGEEVWKRTAEEAQANRTHDEL